MCELHSVSRGGWHARFVSRVGVGSEGWYVLCVLGVGMHSVCLGVVCVMRGGMLCVTKGDMHSVCRGVVCVRSDDKYSVVCTLGPKGGVFVECVMFSVCLGMVCVLRGGRNSVYKCKAIRQTGREGEVKSGGGNTSVLFYVAVQVEATLAGNTQFN